MLLLHVALVVLVSEAWGAEEGVKYASFRLGEEADLTCEDAVRTDNKILFVIWHLNQTDKNCEIGQKNGVNDRDTCNDGKLLRNGTKGKLVLHIPKFSYSDVGNYSCSFAFSGGAVNFIYHINITAPPKISSWVESRGDRRVVVCRAERASPVANISWGVTGNVTVETERGPDGLITVESSVEVNTLEEAQNTSCTIRHVYWDEPRVIVPNINNSQAISQNLPVVYTTILISVVFCLGLLVLGIKKVIDLRMNQNSSKSVDYVEEVEPYESYVQRVNSIYNSSRDLFV
ncbi:cell surface glycoprotein CD200 receptor 1-A isoform X2 [Periophthalmus magnuspinnatus]|uniref:cell surface glycoprotein CD200 receptor 1-A isoform X2 n=1 Tax=Periophthalmus magnuspinnatus TaxID=409849 RepID=UPI00145BE68A|nr:cell surface glycoprotein CD200 receptor 1-A isoform X2 [Periophthalmus magnuspinnatus]